VNRLTVLLAGLGIFVAVGLIVPHISSGPKGDGNASANVTVVITRDYGKILLQMAQFPPTSGLTAMEMLHNMTSVETRYGGMYVYSMFGLKSDLAKKLDWLYYVNGVYMDRGLASYRPQQGEVVQVDYHYWGSYPPSPGFLSGYPAKLAYGLHGKKSNITIVAGREVRKEAEDLARVITQLAGREPTIVEASSLTEDRRDEDLIVLATPQTASLYQEVVEWRKNVYWFSSLEDGKLWLNGLERGHRTELEHGCAIQCMDFPGKGIWAVIVLATDERWMAEGLRYLNEGSAGYSAAFAATPSGIVLLPVE